MSPPASTDSLMAYIDGNRLFNAKPTIRFSLANINGGLRGLSEGPYSAAALQRERDYASDTRLGNRARVSKPIEITDRGILVCHQRRRKHPSCVRLAPRRDADNLERHRWSFARVRENYYLRHILNDWNDRLPRRSRDKGRQSLLLSHGICQLLYTVL